MNPPASNASHFGQVSAKYTNIKYCLISVGHIVWCFVLLLKKWLVLVKLDYFEKDTY